MSRDTSCDAADAHAGQSAYQALQRVQGVMATDLRHRRNRLVCGTVDGHAGTPGASRGRTGANADESRRTRGEDGAGERRGRGGGAGKVDGENGSKGNERCIGKITLILGLGWRTARASPGRISPERFAAGACGLAGISVHTARADLGAHDRALCLLEERNIVATY